jgi:hypothetical protein
MSAEDNGASSVVRWSKFAAISAIGSLILAGLQPVAAQPPTTTRGQVCAETGRYVVSSGTVEVTGGGDASAFGDLACGNGAVASGGGTTAVGTFAGFNSNDLRNLNNTFLGNNSGNKVVGAQNIAVGDETGNTVQGSDNAALGTRAGSQVTGNANVAIGLNAGKNVHGNGHVAVGQNAGSGTSETPLLGSNTVAIGEQAVAIADGGVAIGYGARATRANQFVLGTAASTYSIPGIVSPTSRAATGGSVQIVTSDADGNLVTNTAASLELATISEVNAVKSRLANLEARLKELEERMQRLTR